MAAKKAAKFIQVTIRLGATQSYEVSADERVTITPREAELFASSAEGSSDQVVLDILTKLLSAFGASDPSIPVTAEGGKIVLPSGS